MLLKKSYKLVGLLAGPGEKTGRVQQLVGLFTEELQQPEEFNDDFQFVRQAVAQVPWGHHVIILTKIKDPNEAVFYIQQTIEHNWSRTSLVLELVRHCLSFLKFKFANSIFLLP